MESPRLPRFQRASSVSPVELTDRDRFILRLLHRHRFLRSSHLIALIGGSPQPLLRRLQLLFHHGYLARPRAQLEYFHRGGGSRPMVYGLGSKSGKLRKAQLGSSYRPYRWSEKNSAVGRIYLEHALLVSDLLVALELACRRSSRVRLLMDEDLLLPHKPSWKVTVDGHVRLGLVPDRVFTLERVREDNSVDRAYFFLEADRGTMPVTRRNLAQTSFARKLLAYEATWSQGIHEKRLGFHRFRVLTVTKSPERVKSLVQACAQLPRGHGLFLFADRRVLEHPDILFAPVWQNGRGEPTSLLP